MLSIETITVVAYIFRDYDLVQNLLGISPFADKGCTAVFTAQNFKLFHKGDKPIMIGTRQAHNLWRVARPAQQQQHHSLPTYEANQVKLLHHTAQSIAEHIRFVHACLGNPPPTTFLRAVVRGYITRPNQFPRLTTKNVRKYMPNSEATARGHLRKSPTGQPHAQSTAVSALQRNHQAQHIKQILKMMNHKLKTPQLTLDRTTITRATTLHLDYTGALPERCHSGTLYFMITPAPFPKYHETYYTLHTKERCIRWNDF